jgi:hypothetical protein
MSVVIQDTLVNLGTADFVPATPLSHRNMIINGAMQVAQRGTSFTSVTSSAYHLDRFQTILASVGTYTITQETASPPAGFTSSYKIACTAANSSNDAGDAGVLYYTFEGQDVYHLKYNSSGAVTTTLSFWVKAKETGNYQVNLVGNNRHIGATYTISVADTWEYKTITFAGDTSGNWMSSNNTAGGRIEWWLEGGSNYVGGAVPTSWEAVSATDRNAGQTAQKLGNDTANYWQISGIQWEKGSVATPFENRSYADELAKCQRYYHTIIGPNANGYYALNVWSYNTSNIQGIYNIPIEMNHTPVLVQGTGTSYYTWYQAAAAKKNASSVLSTGATRNTILFYDNTSSAFVQGDGGGLYLANAASYLHLEAEL